MKPINPNGVNNFTQVLQSFYKVLVGNTSLGSASKYDTNGNGTVFATDNGDGVIIRVGSVSNPFALTNYWVGNNIATTITHNLNRRPIGFIVLQKSNSCDIYNSAPFTATLTTITLFCTTGGADVLLYIF